MRLTGTSRRPTSRSTVVALTAEAVDAARAVRTRPHRQSLDESAPLRRRSRPSQKFSPVHPPDPAPSSEAKTIRVPQSPVPPVTRSTSTSPMPVTRHVADVCTPGAARTAWRSTVEQRCQAPRTCCQTKTPLSPRAIALDPARRVVAVPLGRRARAAPTGSWARSSPSTAARGGASASVSGAALAGQDGSVAARSRQRIDREAARRAGPAARRRGGRTAGRRRRRIHRATALSRQRRRRTR